MVELFVTKYPVSKRQTNKAGLTASQIAQKLKFASIVELIETGEAVPLSTRKPEPKADGPKHNYETLLQASRDGHIKIIKEFIYQCYDSTEQKRQLCNELILVAKQAKQWEIVDILETYYKTLSKIELHGSLTLNEHHQRILRGFLSSLSTVIADSPVVLDPIDPNTYEDFFSALTSSIAKRSQELGQVASEQDVKRLIEREDMSTKEQMIKISEQLEQLLESKDSLQARMQDTDERLFKQQNLTAIQRKAFAKEKEAHKQQLAIYECSLFLFQRQQEATLIRQKTIDFIKGNTNLIMFYRTIENRLEALFHSVLAAQGGYLKREATAKFGKTSQVSSLWPTKIPIRKCVHQFS